LGGRTHCSGELGGEGEREVCSEELKCSSGAPSCCMMCDCVFHIPHIFTGPGGGSGKREEIDVHNHRLSVPSPSKGHLLENPTVKQPNPRGSASSCRREKIACYWVYSSLSYPFHPTPNKCIHPCIHQPLNQPNSANTKHPTPTVTFFNKKQTKANQVPDTRFPRMTIPFRSRSIR
jgi:hypothetical protein